MMKLLARALMRSGKHTAAVPCAQRAKRGGVWGEEAGLSSGKHTAAVPCAQQVGEGGSG